MFVARFAARVAVVCLLAAPGAALAQSAPMQSPDSPASRVTDRVLTKVVIYGSIGAIVGALGSLRRRGGADTTLDNDDRTTNP